jgi:hypothetical protein
MDGAATTPGGQDAKGGEGPAANCAVCGKSLRGVEVGGDCSNCGTPAALSLRPLVAAPSQPAPLKMTNRGQVVADDRPCLVCGYNLKAIPTDGKCPECGTPVARSLQGDLLRYCSPEYVRTLRRGITLVEVAIALGMLSTLGIFIASAIVVFNTGAIKFGTQWFKPSSVTTTGPVLHGLLYERIIQLVKTTISAVSLLGWWLFSTQDPGLAERDPAHKSRQVLRVFLALSAIAAGATLLVTFVPSLMTQASAASGNFLGPLPTKLILSWLANIAFLVAFVASLTYMIHLARRVPDAALQKRADLYRWLLPVIFVGGFLICGLGPLTAFIMYVLLIDEWRRRMGRLSESVLQEDLGGAGGVA